MEFDKNTPKKEITISDVVLTVISPFSEGMVCDAAMANVLNQTLAENLRNNFAPVVKQAKEAAGGADQVDVKALQDALNEYTKEYSFGARRQAGPAVNPVDKIAISLAKDAVRKALKKQGKDPKDFPAEQILDLAKAAIDKNPAFRASAEKVYAAKKEAGMESLADLAA